MALLSAPSTMPFHGDAQGQFYVAERAASGLPPHASSINAKNGLGFMMPGWVIKAGRWFDIDDVHAVRAYGIVLLATTVALAWLVTARIAGTRAADLAALAVLAMHLYVTMAIVGVQPKTLLVVFLLLTGLAVARRQWMAAGGVAAAAFLSWQPAAIALLAAPIAPILDRRRREAVRFVAGALVVLVVYEAYYLARGLLAEQWSQAYVLPARFMSTYRPEWLQETAVNALRGYRIGAITIPFAALWAIRYWRKVLGRRSNGILPAIAGDPAVAYWQVSAVAWGLFTLVEVQGAPDLFVFVPFLALGTGVVLAGEGGRGSLGYPAPRWAIAVVITALTAGALLGPLVRRSQYGATTLSDQRALALEVRELADRSEGIFALNCTHLLALDRRENWTRYGHVFRGVPEYLDARFGPTFDPLRRNERLPEIVLERPRKWTLPSLQAELARSYERVPRSDFDRQGIAVYRLRR